MANPFPLWRISCDWACHRARGSRGGIDYAIGRGTPIYAPFDGVVRPRWDALGGKQFVLTRSDGFALYGLHLDTAPVERTVKRGDWIGNSGNTGSATTGPHLHIHGLVNGIVVNPFDYITTPEAAVAEFIKGETVSTVGIKSARTGEHYRFFKPYGMNSRAVIINGSVCYKFPDQGQFQHWLNFNGLGRWNTIEPFVETVGDKSMSEATRRKIFNDIAKVYNGN